MTRKKGVTAEKRLFCAEYSRNRHTQDTFATSAKDLGVKRHGEEKGPRPIKEHFAQDAQEIDKLKHQKPPACEISDSSQNPKSRIRHKSLRIK
jgi:hypothetical protein